jgi:enterochelin esterase-like enzyme
MTSKIVLTFCLVVFYIKISAQDSIPFVSSGRIERIKFNSSHIGKRYIDVWLPDGYSTSTKYSVLYMHDGQMLFDSTKTWNKQAWNVDDIASNLMKQNKTRNFIVIGIWNGEESRRVEYFPQKPFQKLKKYEKDSVTKQYKAVGLRDNKFIPNSDNYLRFLVKELKPYIDKNYSVLRDKDNTIIGGSSMGGLISIYALCEYPKIFGGVACISTHWTGTFTRENNVIPEAFLKYLHAKLPKPGHHKLYFDCGDQTLDALYPDIQLKVDELIKNIGYSERDWITHYFPGEDHSEKSWSKRLHIPLEFLLKK